MSNLGYLRPHTSCEYLTKGRLYPIEHEINGYYICEDDIWFTKGRSDFDYLPPDNGLGWVKTIRCCYWGDYEVGDIFLVERFIDRLPEFNLPVDGDFQLLNALPDAFEYIPPYAEAKEESETEWDEINGGYLLETKPQTIKLTNDSKNEAAERDQPGIDAAQKWNPTQQDLDNAARISTQVVIDAMDKGEPLGFTLALANDAQERATKPNGWRW